MLVFVRNKVRQFEWSGQVGTYLDAREDVKRFHDVNEWCAIIGLLV
jgi:hypothetical protein